MCSSAPGEGTVDAIQTDNISVAQIMAAGQLTELWMAGLEPAAHQSLTVTEVGKAYKIAFDAVVS